MAKEQEERALTVWLSECPLDSSSAQDHLLSTYEGATLGTPQWGGLTAKRTLQALPLSGTPLSGLRPIVIHGISLPPFSL